MNKSAILHLSESFMAYAIGEDELNIRLRAGREDEVDVSLLYTYKFDYPHSWQEANMEKTFVDELFAYYEINIKIKDKRFAYIFKIEEANKTYYLSEYGLEETYDLDNFTSHHFICHISTRQIFLSQSNG